MILLAGQSPWDVPALLYLFGALGILLPFLFIAFEALFLLRKTGRNRFFGYRTPFSMFSPERWEWANRTLACATFLYEPVVLVLHLVFLSLSLVLEWGFLPPLVTFLLSLLHLFVVIPYVEIRGRRKFKDVPERPFEMNRD